MDQVKIGRFIAERRKQCGYTQMQLAEKLNITDRAVSKWETGRSMPDSSIMPELCELLGITLNDLFNREVVVMEDYKKKSEELIIEMTRQKEAADKKLLSLEIVIGILAMLAPFCMIILASFVTMPDWLRICLIIVGFVPCIIGIMYALKIEQTAGYYECAECGHRYVPSFRSVLFAPHFGRTRRMTCPKCHRKSWQKKVINK
jgi:transcriptional regulator with XRE-family HTH domain